MLLDKNTQILIETFLKDAGIKTVVFEEINGDTVCVVDDYKPSMNVDSANRSLEKLNIRLVQKVQEVNSVRKDFYVILDLSTVQKVKQICINNGCPNDFRIDTTTIWGDKKPSISLRYSYWRKLDVDKINPLIEQLGVKLEVVDVDDDEDTGRLFTNTLINL